MPLHAVLLDLGNVLWDDGPTDAWTFHAMRELLRAHGLELDDSEVEAAVNEAVEAWAPSVNDFLLAKFAARAGVERGHAFAEWALVFAPSLEEMLGRVHLFPDVAPALEAMHGAGLRLAVATNYGPVVRALLEARGVGRLIDFWGLAPELGVRKPSPAFFEKVLAGLGALPGEAVMVGDRIDNDIVPAKEAGLATVRLVHGLHAKQRVRSPADAPDYTARSFAEAAAWIMARA